MKRATWIVVSAFTPIAVGLLLRERPEDLTLVTPPAEHLPDVRVQHELVTVPVDIRASNGPARTQVAHSSAKAERALLDLEPEDEPVTAASVSGRQSSTVKRASRDQTLLEKARRAFVGDGRHKPEPFPRPR